MDLVERLGARAERRTTPRIGIALAGAGALIAVVGAIGIGGDNLTSGDGDLQRIPGVLVSAVLIAGGMLVLHRVRSGPIATGSSVSVAVGIPALLVFLTVRDDYPGFAFDVSILLATAAWAAAYLVGPARGRIVLLTLALVGAPIFVLEQVEDISSVPEEIGNAFVSSFFGAAQESFDDSTAFDGSTGFEDAPEPFLPDAPPEPDFPDATTVGGILLAFGVVYAATGHVLNRRLLDGVGTPFAPLAVIATALGLVSLGDDLGELGTGILLVLLGTALTFMGATAARRFTTWSGGALAGIGVVVLVTEALGDTTGTTAFVVLFLAGWAVIFVAHLLVVAIGEPTEEDQRGSLRPTDGPRAGHEPGPPQDADTWAPPTAP